MSSHNVKSVSVVLAVATLAGCSTSVTLQNPTIPDPLIDKLPLAVGVRYPERFEHYVHEEKVIGKDEWTIDLGRSNSMLFTKLFGSMFTDCTIIGPRGDPEKMPTTCNFVPPDTDPHDLQIDALIEPTIDALEFSVPKQSQTDAFAVWIRYRIKIFDHEGNEIANWPISAYGKSATTFMGSDEALSRAAVLAMRDAAALVILQMDKATGISALSANRRALRQDSAAGGAEADTGGTKAVPVNEPLQSTATEETDNESG
ncbi:MAG: hypothetical protein ACREQ8_03720 [Woeseiaceae bacterium]